MRRRLFFLLPLACFMQMASLSAIAQKNDLNLRFQNISLKSGERIVGINIFVTAGSLSSVESLPTGWSITIDNDANWKTSLKGTVEVRAAALNADALRKLNVRIHRYEFMDLKFKVSGTLAVTSDFQTSRIIKLDSNDFVVEADRSSQ